MQILDVGCGTGFFTRLLAEGLSRGKVYGLDIDGEHIAAAREIGRRQGLAGRVEFIQGDALSLPFEDGAFDLVASCTFFNVVKNPRAAMGEMLRVVRMGVVSSLDSMTLGNQTWHRAITEVPWLNWGTGERFGGCTRPFTLWLAWRWACHFEYSFLRASGLKKSGCTPWAGCFHLVTPS